VLDLSAVGFVPLPQAMAFSLKKNEGIPPSAIFIGCSAGSATVSIFRVGKTTGEEVVPLTDDPAVSIETVLKKFQEGDVLPSRMLLYGGNSALLEEVHSRLLKYPWPTRANFLHFPKVEVVGIDPLLAAVSLAGASELAAEIGEIPTEVGEITTAVAQPRPSEPVEDALAAERALRKEGVIADAAIAEEIAATGEAPEELDDEEDELESALAAPDEEEDTEEDEVVSDEEEVKEDEGEVMVPGSEETFSDEHANVEMVSPEALGFKKQEVPQRPHAPQMHESLPNRTPANESPAKKLIPVAVRLPAMPKLPLDGIKRMFTGFPRMKGAHLPLIGILAAVVMLCGLLYVFVPHAQITVLVLPQTVKESATIAVDPTASAADASGKVIPGKSQEKSVSGEKTATVTGKKKVGDPAKGTVTLYNKVTNGRTLPKGTVLSANGLSFTLDADVSVASASESIGSITFGKADAAVTASAIGTGGNLPAGTEFTFKDISATSLSARNDSALSGGTSKEVTVVSRADQDALVKALTDDLVGQAKAQLLDQVGGNRLIDQTIKTQVSDKTFTEELDQEAKELHGKVTITVSGISVSDEDIKSILLPLVSSKLPQGYSPANGQQAITVSNAQVKKDGKISLSAELAVTALPSIDTNSLLTKLVGKDVTAAQDILKQTSGVAGAEFRFTLSPTKSRLPIRAGNISVTTAVAP
jgi:hypothetical protein